MTRLAPAWAALALLAFSSQASAQECVRPSIGECPSLYVQECRDDEAFRSGNALSCLDALSGKPDAESCAAYDAAACAPPDCSDVDDPIDAHFCKSNMMTCPRSIPDLVDGYDSVLALLDVALEPYAGLIALNPREIGDKDQLCAFSGGQLEEFKSLAEQDTENLSDYRADLSQLLACANTMNEFIEGGPPEVISEELWDGIRSLLVEGMTQLKQREGAVYTRIEKLEGAPKRIRDLTLAYNLACRRSNPSKPATGN